MRIPKYTNLSESRDRLVDLDNCHLADFKDRSKIVEQELYLSLLSMIKYKMDAYDTNKLAHFIRILRERGVEVRLNPSNPEKYSSVRNEVIELRRENFDPELDAVKKINEILKIPKDEIENYANYFIDEKKRQNHFNMCNFFFKTTEECKKDLLKDNDFKCNIIGSDKNKILVLREMFDAYGGTIDSDSGVIEIDDEKITNKKRNELSENYMMTFRVRKSEFSMEKLIDVKKALINSMKHLFGNDIVNVEYAQVQKNGKRTRMPKYKINNEMIEINRILFNFRNVNLEKKCHDIIKFDIRKIQNR